MRTRSHITTPKNGVTWYYEQEGSGPDIVLITDGFGESQMFDRTITKIAQQGFRVTTFDGPGMSRSSEAPPEAYNDVTAQKLAAQVIDVIDVLGIREAAFWGSSSGGSTVLALAADYPDRVRNGLVHEVPFVQVGAQRGVFAEAAEWDDETVSKRMGPLVLKLGMADAEAWAGLGDAVHERLAKNFVRWIRGFPPLTASSPTGEAALKKRPLDWTVGFSTPSGLFFDNIVLAVKMGIPVQTIPGRHFPYLCEPEAFAEYVVSTCQKYLSD